MTTTTTNNDDATRIKKAHALDTNPDHDAGTNTNGTGEQGTGQEKMTTGAGARDASTSRAPGMFFFPFFLTLITLIY